MYGFQVEKIGCLSSVGNPDRPAFHARLGVPAEEFADCPVEVGTELDPTEEAGTPVVVVGTAVGVGEVVFATDVEPPVGISDEDPEFPELGLVYDGLAPPVQYSS